ncbi:hypothetical protein HHI36_009323 [Cryptolaemus montrouzieri]|uniref:SIAH-type domain-containing protein n=1 Tax=Cryptolaemus montrouzieri TaxID=559131 RepID=A0ABD2MUX3_9CUCU
MQNFVENPNSIVIEFEYDSIKLGSSINSLTVPKILYDGVVSDDLRNAKCDNCKKELVPPVFMCLRAHNICGSCKISEACPKCTVFLTKSTNTAFEKLKFLVNQPCSNYSKGCNYSGPYPNILDHEDICIFKLRKCILGCPQEVNNILQHLKLEHSHSISELNISYNLNLLKSHVFLFDDQIFLFSKQLEIDRSFSFNINCLGMKEVRYKLNFS